MKIPKQVKIGGHYYQVIFRDRVKEDGKDAPASVDNKYNRIWIDNQWAESQQETSFLHEIIEAISWLWKLNFTEEQIRRWIAEGYGNKVERVEYDRIWNDYEVHLR